jgi:hypothetical protein
MTLEVDIKTLGVFGTLFVGVYGLIYKHVLGIHKGLVDIAVHIARHDERLKAIEKQKDAA